MRIDRVASSDEDGPRLVTEDPEKNGHLWQWWQGAALSGTLNVAVRLRAGGGEGRVGVNVYTYADPTDDTNFRVVQLQSQGDGCWEVLTRKIPIGDTPVCRVRLLIVARVGTTFFSVAHASMSLAGPEAVSVSAETSDPYRDAVNAMVDRHPAATDQAFREKFTRYLLGANPKGFRTVTMIEGHLRPLGLSFQGARFLDLGSGTGGALVGALRAGASYCEGWEINQEKLALSAINVHSRGADGEGVVVRNQSVEACEELGDGFVPFDIVFCEEVLEHVKDLPGAITTLARCIDPEKGVGYVTMPNGFALESVMADPHLQLFGITLLDRFEAQPMATALKNHTHYAKMMGAYCHYEDYVAQFGAVGLTLMPLVEPETTGASFEKMSGDLEAIETRRRGLGEQWGDVLEGETLTLLDRRLETYVTKAQARLEAAQVRVATEEEKRAVARDYGQGHFSFLVRHCANKTHR